MNHYTDQEYGFSDASKVPVDYLLRCLSTLNPNHRIFEKTYYPDDGKVMTRKLAEDTQIVDNSDGFFSGLRSSQNKSSKNTIQFTEADVKWKMGMM